MRIICVSLINFFHILFDGELCFAFCCGICVSAFNFVSWFNMFHCFILFPFSHHSFLWEICCCVSLFYFGSISWFCFFSIDLFFFMFSFIFCLRFSKRMFMRETTRIWLLFSLRANSDKLQQFIFWSNWVQRNSFFFKRKKVRIFNLLCFKRCQSGWQRWHGSWMCAFCCRKWKSEWSVNLCLVLTFFSTFTAVRYLHRSGLDLSAQVHEKKQQLLVRF